MNRIDYISKKYQKPLNAFLKENQVWVLVKRFDNFHKGSVWTIQESILKDHWNLEQSGGDGFVHNVTDEFVLSHWDALINE